MKKNFRNIGPVILFGVFFCVASFGHYTDSAIAEPIGEPLPIGVLGVFSGAAASWGLPLKYTTEITAERINSEGGLLVDGVRHPIKLYAEDDKFDVKVTRAAAEKMIFEHKVKYIMGPNASLECSALTVVSEPAKVIYVGYGHGTKALWGPQHPYGILGMRAGYETAPFAYSYLMEKHKVKSVILITKNYEGGLKIQNLSAEAAKKLGLNVISAKETYEPNTVDFFPLMGRVVKQNPDFLDLTAASSYDAALISKTARQLGYKGPIMMTTSNDAATVNQVAGKLGEGLLWIGNIVPGSGLATPAMDKLKEAYVKKVGEWNEPAAGFVYALEMVAYTLQKAGSKALKDTDVFRKAMPSIEWPDPYIKGNIKIRYIGKEIFGHNQQIGKPIVLMQMKDGVGVPIKIGEY